MCSVERARKAETEKSEAVADEAGGVAVEIEAGEEGVGREEAM